jgi:hypothetical protein
MRIDDGIRRLGFRRWYERRLIEGHAYVVTGILALFAMLAAVEMLEFKESAAGFLALACIVFGGGALCLFAFRQFTRLVFGAEHLAGQAHCPKCNTYARFQILHAADAPNTLEGRVMKVRCRVCETEWTIG